MHTTCLVLEDSHFNLVKPPTVKPPSHPTSTQATLPAIQFKVEAVNQAVNQANNL